MSGLRPVPACAGLLLISGAVALLLAVSAGYGYHRDEAGAVRFYRPGIAVYGSQNSMWDLGGPGPDTRQAVVLGFNPARLPETTSVVCEAVLRVYDRSAHRRSGLHGHYAVWVFHSALLRAL